MTLKRLQARLTRVVSSPRFLLSDITDCDAEFVPMTRRTYRASPFLDERMFTVHPLTYRLALDELIEHHREGGCQARPLRYIFHSGFCGSTLLARCLDHPSLCLAYKEPRVLSRLYISQHPLSATSPFSDDQWQQLSQIALALLSKTYAPNEVALIKLHNLCTVGMRHMMNVQSDQPPRGIFLYCNLETFLCSVLKMTSRRQWVRQCLRSIEAFVAPSLRQVSIASLSDVQAAAYLWIWQAEQYRSATDANVPHRVPTLNCEDFFQNPKETLAAVCSFFDFPLTDQDIERIVQSRVFRVHSKETLGGFAGARVSTLLRRMGWTWANPSLPFNDARRRSQIARNAEDYAEELRQGLDWAASIVPDKSMLTTLPNPLIK